MDNNTSYETQAIDLSLLSVLDITKEGKVVSAEKWSELWALVFKHINKIDTFCVDMQTTLDNWHIAAEELTELSKDMQMKYWSLSTGFTHYGEEPPQNPYINFWVRSMGDISTHCFLTNEDVDFELSSTSENPVQNKVVNAALNNKMDKNNPTGTGSFSLNRKSDTAVGDYSFTEGNSTTASGNNSHAEGFNTEASSDYQHVQGKYNISDSNNMYADIVGNGTSNTKRSNAATVDWNGNAWYAGTVYVGSTSGTNRDEGSKKLATEKYVDTQINGKQNTLVSGINIRTINGNSILGSGNILIEGGSGGSIIIDQTYAPTSENAQSGKAVKEAINKAASIIPGSGNSSIMQNSVGAVSSGIASISFGTSVKTYGDYSVGMGASLQTYGKNAANIGFQSESYNNDSISLGRQNKNYSHTGITAGYNNIAGKEEYKYKQWGDDPARGAIVMGWCNKATHANACVFGKTNNSSRDYQTVFGRYCADDPNALFILGNGTSVDNRSNSYTVDKDGNACFTGGVYVGSSKKDGAGSKRLATEEYIDKKIEEGTWTPKLYTISLGGVAAVQPTYTTIYANGTYYKIGDLVYVNCDANFIVTDGGTGWASIKGFPFVSRDNASMAVAEACGGIRYGDGPNDYLSYGDSSTILLNQGQTFASIRCGNGIVSSTFKSGFTTESGSHKNYLWIKFSGVYRIA